MRQVVYAYSAYGETAVLGPDGGNALRYTGREDDGNGLFYYRARYYDPVLKRFVSEDPIGLEAGPNFYLYVGGNPITRNDPEGKFFFEILDPVHIMVGRGSAGLIMGGAITSAGYAGYVAGTGINRAIVNRYGQNAGGALYDILHGEAEARLLGNSIPPSNPNGTQTGSTPQNVCIAAADLSSCYAMCSTIAKAMGDPRGRLYEARCRARCSATGGAL